MARSTPRRAAVERHMRTKGYTAAECLRDNRRLLAAIIEFLLRLTSGVPKARMKFTREEISNLPKIIFAYGVRLRRWPKHLKFKSPGCFSSNDDLLELIGGFKTGRIRFERVSPAQVEALERKYGISGAPARKARRGAGSRAPLRPIATRSRRLRKCPINTPKYVPEGADAAEIDWEAWMATHQPGYRATAAA